MIRSEAEYQEALVQAGLSPDQVDSAMQPLLSFKTRLAEEVEWYEHVRRRSFPEINGLTQIGLLLIALRIANGISQHELAERLGVSESIVSRDERNEYHGITIERAQRVLDALGALVVVKVADPQSKAS